MKVIIRSLKMSYNTLFNAQAHENLMIMKFHDDISSIHEDIDNFKKKYNIHEISVYENNSNKFMSLLFDNKLKN